MAMSSGQASPKVVLRSSWPAARWLWMAKLVHLSLIRVLLSSVSAEGMSSAARIEGVLYPAETCCWTRVS
jgi:hypothetical protein